MFTSGTGNLNENIVFVCVFGLVKWDMVIPVRELEQEFCLFDSSCFGKCLRRLCFYKEKGNVAVYETVITCEMCWWHLIAWEQNGAVS